LRRALPLVALLVASYAGAQTLPALAQRIDAITSVPPLDAAIWGIYVADDAGKTIYARNEQTLMTPASNRKLFAAATAASCNALDRQLTTELWRDGDDVILRR
jgi:D-alanyl-D-alanine carboxypeptidase